MVAVKQQLHATPEEAVAAFDPSRFETQPELKTETPAVANVSVIVING
jgi:hypothetical protein